jgi:hypothetical protein
MSSHPYKQVPQTAFWKQGVAEGFDLNSVMGPVVLVRAGDKVASAGSCFAANIVPYLEKAGFHYIRRGQLRAPFCNLGPENFSYAKFSAAYGNIYTARAMAQLLQRALGRFRPIEDRWIAEDGTIIDPFRPGLKYPSESHAEFDQLMARYLSDVLEVVRSADVFVFTLGLTEAWISSADGAVFPACPGTIAGRFDPARHKFHNFTVAEVIADLNEVIRLWREINPGIRVILTVSPVPLVATATGDHVLPATIYSKSVLRAAAGEVARQHEDVTYFPAYEIVTGPQAPYEFFEADRREPSKMAIDAVMSVLLAHCETTQGGGIFQPETVAPRPNFSQMAMRLSQIVADAECEEAAAGL